MIVIGVSWFFLKSTSLNDLIEEANQCQSYQLVGNMEMLEKMCIRDSSSTDITSIYLKTDLDKLKECVLDLVFDDEYINIR